MKKGQAIVGLILIAAMAILLYFFLAKPPTIRPPSEVKYSDDIITVENILLSELEPRPGVRVAISFTIRNNGDRSVEGIEVNFFSPGFIEPKIKCENLEEKSTYCILKELKPLDEKDVRFSFLAPNVAKPTPFTIKFYLNYSYSGFRLANIPIIDGTTVKEPTTAFFQSEPTYGPVRVEFIPPVASRIVEEGKVIERNWGVSSIPFKAGARIIHVGTVKKVYPINIFYINFALANMERAENYPCTFKDSLILDPEREMELTCFFISTTTEPQTIATLKVEFNYTYQFEGEQTIVVTPPTV